MRDWLAHPLTRGLDLDDPRTTLHRREILDRKPFLRRLYRDWYEQLAAELPAPAGRVLEVGSGAGFLAEHVPGLVSSEVFLLPGLDCVLDATRLPFTAGSLGGIVGTNVLHHLPRTTSFLTEAARCVRPGGVLAFVEPWVTPWSSWVYRHLHHEPFDPGARDWELPASGPLSGANGALPWMLFCRDRARLEREHPAWEVRSIRPQMPFRYLLSGGISLRLTMPGWSYSLWSRLEAALGGREAALAMFALVVLQRTERPHSPR